jgi:hypothetical protein
MPEGALGNIIIRRWTSLFPAIDSFTLVGELLENVRNVFFLYLFGS